MSSDEETEYKKLWNKIRENLNITAKEFVPQLYDLLKQEGYTPKEAREKLKKDAFNIWKVETVDKWIPQEAKQEIKVAAGQQRGKTKTEIEKSEDINKDSAVFDPAESNNTKGYTEEQPPLAPYTATDEFMKREQEAELTEQLLKEERLKTAGLLAQIEQKDRELEDHASRMQELSRRLTEATTHEVDENKEEKGYEVEKPTFETHWNQFLDSECDFCQKVTPYVIRHFISGKVVKWIDRERYKELYGVVPKL